MSTIKERIDCVDLKSAAKRLAVSVRTVHTLIARDLFTVQQNAPGGDRYLLSDELDCWIESVGTPDEREARLREFRIRKRRIKK